ncbi:amino acid adenylation domain-containing protein [Nocardiopsis quinghaiensis]|uniref:amino acid adenylation domain-containing protein n=1 Tax=Nocardiopsis quinghaiensis TaxID=464995 RepID=UPI001238E4CC|nr:non-ribosomal peptide synthetase [Nocardiopsis quinghaiensis]
MTNKTRHPLNDYQRDIWAAESRFTQSPQFNVAAHERLEGDIDHALLRGCVARVLRRHDAFRLRFFEDTDGTPWAELPENEDIRWSELIECVDLTRGDRSGAAVRDWLNAALYRPLDPRVGPLVQAALVIEHEHAVHLLVKAHHIVADAWSLNSVTLEILNAYRSERIGDGPPKLRTSSFTKTLGNPDRSHPPLAASDDQEFYQKYLDGVSPALFTRTSTGLSRRGRHSFTIDGKTVRRILEAGGSPLAYLASALSVVLSRVHRSSEVVLGVPFLNRRTEEEREVVGQFANNLPLRVAVEEDEPLFDLASRVRTDLRGLRAHERLPFGEILRQAPDRGAGPRRLFDVTVSYMRYPRPSALPGVRRDTTIMAPVHEENALSVMVHAFEDEDDLRVDLDFALDVFDGDLSAEALAGHVRELLRKGLDLRELPLSALSMLTSAEYEEVVRLRQGESTRYPGEKTLHGLFAEQAERTPGLTAVVDDASGAETTYAELDRAANQVARALRADGVGPDDRVAVVAERGPELMPALLGVLRAGGAYVPVDPGHPEARVRVLLGESGAKAVLTSDGVRVQVPVGTPVHRVHDLLNGADAPLAPVSGSSDLAYVIYTSGSTGRPKGVMVEHHSVVNRLTWMQRRYPIGPGDTLLQKTPTSFDVSVWELFWWGAEGAGVALLPPGAEKDPREIARAIRRHRVTAVHFVPSMLGPFLDLLEDEPGLRTGLDSLRYVFCSGEALPAERVRRFHRVFDTAGRPDGDTSAPLLVNLYGPTEAAVDVSYHDLPAGGAPVDRVPIGRPVENTTLYVLGEHGGPQPVGAPGELHIGGVQVARGYLDRPELTRERFLKDPFNPGGRLYRTGDLARLLADGTIEYLGRIDGQVKIRGNRVELGEVENTLVSVEGVREAAVVDHRPEGRDALLVAYYAGREELTPAGLRAALSRSLPDYMLPSLFVRLNRIPLSPNGKTDRRALPAPELPGDLTEGGGPRNPTEETLARVWAEALGVRRVGVHDDYYALGGDSISMLRVRALAERAGVGFSLSDLVGNPTVADLASVATRVGAGASRQRTDLAPFALVSRMDRARLEGWADAYPLTRLQLGLLYHSREHEGSAVYKDVFRYSLALPWDESAMRAAFDRLMARHPVLRSSFDLAGHSEPLQLVKHTVDGALSVVDLRGEPAERAEEAVVSHMRERRVHPYVFDRAPLHHFRFFVLPDSVELVLSFHHALLDGGSVANLVSELLQNHLRSLGLDVGAVPEHSLPSPALHVADERAATGSEESRAYWRRALEGAVPPQLEGFAPHEPPRPGGDPVVVRNVPLPASLVSKVGALAREREAPLKSVLLAAHVATLRVFSGQDDLTTGLVTHGRPEVEDGDRVCGLFLNTVPMRVSAESATWFDTVREVVEREREGHPHRRVPLATVQEDLGGGTLVDTAFNFVHFRQLGTVFSLPGVENRGFEAWEETNFALLLNAMVDPVDGGITLRLDLSGRRFTPAQGDLYADTLVRVLRLLAEHPDSAADPSELVGPAAPEPVTAAPQDVVRAFGEQARRHADDTALVFGERSWTYAELDERSAHVARVLLGVGVRPHDRVGVAMDRSPEAVATLVGIARAGASVVPLDTSYPVRRLRSMVESAEPVRIVAHEHHAHLVEDGERLLPAEFLFDGTLPAGPGRGVDLPRISPENEAYVLFTSGSTGLPKGVSMPHRSLANLVAWQNVRPSGAAGGRTLQYAPASFDVSFQEVYSTLCGGGTLVLVTEELRRDMPALLRLMDQEGVERVFLPYVALQRLAEAADGLGIVPRSLRVLASSGEQLRVTDEIRRFCAALDDVLLENQYGPTESHVVTVHTMTGDPSDFPSLPPTGKAIDGARVLVLDGRGRPVPVGGRGEIHLGGVCLADGYVGRPDLTAERFLNSDGERLYRTGDIGMVLPGGDVVCLGRSDRQVKVRGFRVEPAEVELAIGEAAATGLASLREVAVVARRREGQDTFLAAFLVGDPDRSDLEALRRRLRSTLPEYMMPSHLEWVGAMPLTPSGKRDDDALRRAALTRGRTCVRVAPRDARERALAEMLADLLGVADLDVHDNVFDLGATSITAMRLVVLIEQRFGVSVPLSEFISAPTVAALAGRVGAERGDRAAAREFDPLVPIRSEGDQPPLFYVHPMGGNVLCYVPFARHLPGDRPFYALQAAGTDAGTEPVRDVEEMARSYVEAIRRVRPEGPYHIGGWSFGGFVAFEMARQLRAAGQEVASLVLLDTTALNPGRRPWTDDEALIGWFFWELLWLERGGESPEAVIPAELTTLDEKFEFITRLAVDEGVLPPGSTDAIVRRLFRLYEANWRSAFAYRPEGADLDAVLVHAREPLPDVLMSMHSAIGSMHADPANGWREYTSGRLTVVDVSGDHLTIMEEPHVAEVVRTVMEAVSPRLQGGR